MGRKGSNRIRNIGLLLTPNEYATLERKWKESTCRKRSDYVRRCLFDKPIVTTYRDRSLDDFMSEMIRLRAELKGIGNNFNQATKRLHALQQLPEFRNWLTTYEMEKNILFIKIEEIKNHIQKFAEKWLQ